MASTVELTWVASTILGELSKPFASRLISSENVADRDLNNFYNQK